MFLGSPCVYLPRSQTPAGCPHLAITMCLCCPRGSDGEGSSILSCFEAQSRGFYTHCLRFLAFVTSGGQDSFPAGG